MSGALGCRTARPATPRLPARPLSGLVTAGSDRSRHRVSRRKRLTSLGGIGVCVVLSALLLQLCSAERQAPRFITQPSSSGSMVNEGYTKIMQCQAFGAPQPEYRWLKNGQYLGDFTSEHFYRIQQTRRADAGEYQCIARNSVGAIFSEKAQVAVAYMSQFNSTEPRTVTVQSGHAAVLDLPPIDSQPKPSVRWETTDTPSLYGIKYASTARDQLVILSVELEDQNEYRARATNTQLGTEASSGPITLRVVMGGEEEVPPQIVVPPADLETMHGDIGKLSCVTNARPLYSLETNWYKDGAPIGQAGVAYSFDDLWNRTLSLLTVGAEHAGVYSCRARLRSASFPEVTAQARVTVLEKPHLDTVLPAATLGDLGRTVTLQCVTRGHPDPVITWYKDTVDVGSLNSEGRYTTMTNGSLVIRNLKVSDTGMYQCTAANRAGEDTAYTWLRVKSSAPVMLAPPENVTVLDGQDATLTCRAEGAPPPDIQWLFNGKLLEDTGGGRVQVLETGDLLIADVRTENSGLYTCRRSNDVGDVSASAVLSIMVRTQITRPPADAKVILGHVASLQCDTSSSPGVATQVTWYRNGRRLAASSRIHVADDGSLEIREVRAADVGRYTCEVVSSGGNASRSAELVVVELPYSPNNVRARKVPSLQKAVRVTWTAGFDGNSQLLKFIVQSRRVPISSMVTGTAPQLGDTWITELANVSAAARDVTLTGLTASAAYQFRLSAVNSVGEGNPSRPSSVVLLPQEAPSGPPQGLVGSARSSAEIMTQWQPPRDEHRNGLVLGYILRYRLHGYSNAPWSSRNITNEAQRNYLIRDLITWKDYDIQVAAYNSKGTGVFSHSITVKTREGVPEAAPTGVRVEPESSTSVRISWVPPDPQKINGINQGYKLQAWTGDPAAPEPPSVTMAVAPSPVDPLARQEALLEGLRSFTAYNVTVLCFTSPGDGTRSDPVAITTLEDVPGAVSDMRFQSVTDRSVTVIWSPPERHNGRITGYTLRRLVDGMAHTLVEQNVTANVTRLQVNNLRPTTEYQFSLLAWTAVGAGPAREATLRSGVKPVLPTPPIGLGVSNIQPFSVVVQFTPGFDGNSSITQWTVQAQTSRNQTWEAIYTASDPTATTLTVDRLVPFMKYRLRIVANNVVGASSPSEPTQEFQTIQAPPAHAPRNVIVRAPSATTLRVGWIPLQQTEWYGVPRGYNISFRRLSEDASRTRLDTISIEDRNANSFVLDQLEEYMRYEIIMQSYNDVGSSEPSVAVTERTRESVPGAGPEAVQANTTSSTTVVVSWGAIQPLQMNGLIEGYKVVYGYKGADFKTKMIEGNQTHTTTLTELRKFTKYSVQVLGRTRVGDGVLSLPPVRVRTYDDVPGAPSNVSFPDVSFTFARVIWDVPEEPNGVLLAYKVTFHPADTTTINSTHELAPQDRTFKATGLQPERSYMFLVAARTRLGWGQVARALVYTTNNRDAPQPPSAPHVSQSQVLSDRITFSWTPGRDGFAPLRYYTVQTAEEGGSWQPHPLRVDPMVTAYTIMHLKPFTTYRFRIQATNDIGPSGWSKASASVKTHPAAPRGLVTDVKAIPITTTAVRVEWRPLSAQAWSGDPYTGGYRVEYRPMSDFPSPLTSSQESTTTDIEARALVLEGLTRGLIYEVSVVAFNSQGDGSPTRPVQVYVGEAFPTGEPQSVTAQSVSSTEIRLSWLPPPATKQNGDILGYKIFYLRAGDEDELEQIDVVPGGHEAHSLLHLDMFTEYSIQILAFNTAGDGPRSRAITARTRTGVPAPPVGLTFSDITMSSLKVSWSAPDRPNGEIQGYLVMYETAVPNEDFSKHVTQKVSTMYLHVQNLEERVSYTFNVRALTIDYGAPASANVTTGPQPGSPGRPQALLLTKTAGSVTLYWQNGVPGNAPIQGYIVEAKRENDDSWRVVARTDSGPLADFVVSYTNLLPSTEYRFRLMAHNKYGVSFPALSEQNVATPSKLFLQYRQPFYRTTWFMVTLAAISVVILIAIIAVLCVKSKSYKYKKKAEAIEETMSMEALAEGFSIEHRSSRRSTLKRNTISRRSTVAAAVPPRPMPASVAYNSDNESKYDENPDDSSLSEKPSEVSSTDSQVDDEDELYYQSGPRSMVGHYTNVNDVCRQSWKRQRPMPPRQAVSPPSAALAAGLRNYASHTDSEQEGSAVMSLNGAEVVVNNRAGSRAPLSSGANGFSSFV